MCCVFVETKHLRDFARPKTDMLRLSESKFAIYVSTDCNIWTTKLKTWPPEKTPIIPSKCWMKCVFEWDDCKSDIFLASGLADFSIAWITQNWCIWLCTSDKVNLKLNLKTRELALLVRRQGLLSNWIYHMIFIVVLDKLKCLRGPTSRSRTYGATIANQNVYLAIIAIQIGYVATIATQSGYVATFRDRRNFVRLCATQRRYVATFRDPNKVCCDHCDSKLVCWVIVRPKYLCDFERPKTDT